MNILGLNLPLAAGWLLLALASSMPALGQAPPFEGWVCYEVQTSSAVDIGKNGSYSQKSDTMFISGQRGIYKTCRARTMSNFRSSLEMTTSSYSVMNDRLLQVRFSAVEVRNEAIDRTTRMATEIIYPDSLQRRQQPQVEVVQLDSTKVILGYPCRQAELRLTFAQPDSVAPGRRTVTVFYTDQLPNVSHQYPGLDGIVLESWSIVETPDREPGFFWGRTWATAIGHGAVPEAYFTPRLLYPGLSIKSQVYDGKPRAVKLPTRFRPLIPSQLRKSKKKYPWAG
jgi:hypothetical protein